MTLTADQLDRAVGAVLVSAAGDALGSQYEFGPALPDDVDPEYGTGVFGHGVGEWTDDTSMAVAILDQLAAGRTLEDPDAVAALVAAWREWALTAKDVGAQTRTVLSLLGDDTGETAARAASKERHDRAGRSGGNGSLMRTGPVALGYLDRSPAELAEAARRVAELTHWEHDNGDAVVLWSLAIRHAILTGELDMLGQLDALPAERRDRWRGFIDEATAPGIHPRDFRAQNGGSSAHSRARSRRSRVRIPRARQSSVPCAGEMTPTPSPRSPVPSQAPCGARARCRMPMRRSSTGGPGSTGRSWRGGRGQLWPDGRSRGDPQRAAAVRTDVYAGCPKR